MMYGSGLVQVAVLGLFRRIYFILFALVISWLCFRLALRPLEQVFNIPRNGRSCRLGVRRIFAHNAKKARFSSLLNCVSGDDFTWICNKQTRCFLEHIDVHNDAASYTITWVRLKFGFARCYWFCSPFFSKSSAASGLVGGRPEEEPNKGAAPDGNSLRFHCRHLKLGRYAKYGLSINHVKLGLAITGLVLQVLAWYRIKLKERVERLATLKHQGSLSECISALGWLVNIKRARPS